MGTDRKDVVSENVQDFLDDAENFGSEGAGPVEVTLSSDSFSTDMVLPSEFLRVMFTALAEHVGKQEKLKQEAEFLYKGIGYTSDELKAYYENYISSEAGTVWVRGRPYKAGQMLRQLDVAAFNYEFKLWVDKQKDEGKLLEY